MAHAILACLALHGNLLDPLSDDTREGEMSCPAPAQTFLQVGLGPSSDEHAMAELSKAPAGLTHSGNLLLQGQ